MVRISLWASRSKSSISAAARLPVWWIVLFGVIACDGQVPENASRKSKVDTHEASNNAPLVVSIEGVDMGDATTSADKAASVQLPPPDHPVLLSTIRRQLLGREIIDWVESEQHAKPSTQSRSEQLRVSAMFQGWLEDVPSRFEAAMVPAVLRVTATRDVGPLVRAGTHGLDVILEGIQEYHDLSLGTAEQLRNREIPQLMKRKIQLRTLLRKQYSKTLEEGVERLEQAIDEVLEVAAHAEGLAVRLSYMRSELRRARALITSEDIGDAANAKSVAAAYSDYIRRAVEK